MKNDVLRLFFALGCPLELAEAISTWRSSLHLHGRPVAAANLHLTLAFLGQQPRARVPELLGLAARLQVPAFELRLDRLVRRRNGLVYLAPSQPIEGLLNLAQALRDALLAAGIGLENRPFLAHLSLLRHCPKLPPDVIPSFDWPATDFALYASEQGAHGTQYRQLQQWPLLRND